MLQNTIANSLVWQIIAQLVINYVDMMKNTTYSVNATVQYTKRGKTHKCNIRINWKFEDNLILPIMIYLVNYVIELASLDHKMDL